MSNIYLTSDFYSDDALNENFQVVVSHLKNRITENLRELAQQLNVPVIVISLTCRVAEKRVNREWQHPAKQKPIVDDICFSSIVKEYADVILLMERRIYGATGRDELKSKVELRGYSDEESLGHYIHFNFWEIL